MHADQFFVHSHDPYSIHILRKFRETKVDPVSVSLYPDPLDLLLPHLLRCMHTPQYIQCTTGLPNQS